MQNKNELKGKAVGLLPVDGNCYHTPNGLFDCQVIEEQDSGSPAGTVKVEVRLTKRVTNKRQSPTVRRYLLYATRRSIEEKRLSLVVEIHEWALSAPKTSEYFEKEVWL